MTDLRRDRPVRITILSIFIFCFAAWNGLRLGEAIYFWKTIAEFNASPLYISISGAAWLITGLLLFWGLWQGKAWGWVAAISGTAGYTIWYWLDRLILQEHHANWPFVLISQIIYLPIIYSILLSPRTKRYFKRGVDERKPKTPTPA